MPSLSAASSSNALYSPSYIPVLVVIGGTSGIGQAMVEQFARQTSGRAHIIIMGRNATAAKTILDSLPKSTVEGDPEMRREFVSCDALLMKSMKETAEGLLERLPKINFLVVCSGWASFRGRNETEEGIDKQMACRYYSRWKLIYELLPLLRKARDAGEDAKVMSVLAAGVPGSVNVQDLAMKKSYSGLKAVTTTALYNDYALEEFSIREPGIAFTHIYPGTVNTPALRDMFPWFLAPLRALVVNFFATTVADSAQYMLFGLLDGDKGFFRRGPKGDIIGSKNYEGSEAIRKALWDHSAEVTNTS